MKIPTIMEELVMEVMERMGHLEAMGVKSLAIIHDSLLESIQEVFDLVEWGASSCT